jgi:hypothetical protein
MDIHFFFRKSKWIIAIRRFLFHFFIDIIIFVYYVPYYRLLGHFSNYMS